MDPGQIKMLQMRRSTNHEEIIIFYKAKVPDDLQSSAFVM